MFAFTSASYRTLSKILIVLPVMALAQIGLSDIALAYRPFDGTDAAVAEPGEMEIELQPAGGLRSEPQKTLVAPATVINYGFAKNWEAVFGGQVQTPLSPSGPTNLSASGAFLKHVLRPGVLQDQPRSERCHGIRRAPAGHQR